VGEQDRAREQLIEELEALRRRVAELEAAPAAANGRHSSRALPGREVSCETSAVYLAELERKGLPPETLTRGTGLLVSHFLDRDQRIYWDTFERLMANVAKVWSPGELVEMGRRFGSTGVARSFAPIGWLLLTPLGCYRLFARERPPGIRFYFRCFEASVWELDLGQLVFEVMAKPGYLPCPTYWHYLEGILTAMPRLVGLSDAAVTRKEVEAGVRFEIRIPPGGGIAARLSHLGRKRRAGRLAARELLATHERLSEHNLELEAEIDQRKSAERALRESEERYRALAEHSCDLVSEVDERGRFLFASPNYREVLGYAPEELLDRDSFEGVHPEDRARTEVGFRRLVETGFTREPPFRYRHADGTWRWLELAARMYRTQRGERRAVVSLRDVSKRVRAEEALAEHREHLEELVQQRTSELASSREQLVRSERMASVGTLAAGIAHQINNPVASILAAAQYALVCEEDSDAQQVWRRALLDCVEEAKRCAKIVRSILQFSRNEASEMWSEDLNDVVGRACDLTRTYAAEHSAQVVFEPVAEPCPARMSPIQIEQVVVNLIRNAIESRATGARVVVRTGLRGESACVDVSDDGRGMSEQDCKRIFDPFFTTRLEVGGTGLGLSVAQGIVLEHSGTIAVDSRVGQGTTVMVELPCEPGRRKGESSISGAR
jgi:PAS domain S-box-containing protein